MTLFAPWTPNGVVSVTDRQWDPEELDQAMNTVVFGTSHGGLRSGHQWGGKSALNL